MVKSETNTDFKGSGFRFGDPQINLKDKFYLYVEGDDLYARSLRSDLSEKLESEGIEVIFTEVLLEKYENH